MAAVAVPGGDATLPWDGERAWRILALGADSETLFLAAWQRWREDTRRPALLHVACIVAAPAGPDALHAAAREQPALQPLADELAARWQGLLPGFHRFAFEQGRVLLTVCVGDTGPVLREQDFEADTVWLRGPVIEPSATLKPLTRLCRRGTLLAADTAGAGWQHALESAGWQMLPASGDALRARYAPAWKLPRDTADASPQPSRAIVVGAGLAGAAVAASLARRGWSVLVVDAAETPAAGASGLPVGLVAPHQSPDDNLLSRLTRSGIRITLQEAQARLARGLEWEATGVLEWRGDDARALPDLGEALDPWSRPASDAQKRAAGWDTAQPAWWHQNAGWIEPAALVRAWLRAPGVRFLGRWKVRRIVREGSQWRIDEADGTRAAVAPLVVVASALQSGALLGDTLRLQPVRGQVTWAPRPEDAAALPPFPVNGNGHFLPNVPLVERGAWITGSTYGRGQAETACRAGDDAANLAKLRTFLPRAAAAVADASTRAWSGVRCASADRRPLVGEVEPGLWVSTAMGSRGLSFAALCAELLAARLHREPLPLPARLAQTLSAARQGPPLHP
jgi:tRNA 5-methylaminomethyl-2-thiouridine biosynthesis bifunctional protein